MLTDRPAGPRAIIFKFVCTLESPGTFKNAHVCVPPPGIVLSSIWDVAWASEFLKGP